MLIGELRTLVAQLQGEVSRLEAELAKTKGGDQ